MQIQTLIPDIYRTIQDKQSGWFTEELADEFATDLSRRLGTRLSENREAPKLRLSGLGPKCPRHLWYSINMPWMAQPLPPQAEVKYTYGEIIESMVLMLAKASGHQVEGMQDELNVDGVLGHRDCVIDGCLVDIKSSSSIGFEKFKNGSIRKDDSFGYLDQLDGYLEGSDNDPLVRVKDRAYLLVVDKTLGHMFLYEHIRRPGRIRDIIKQYRDIVNSPLPPKCECKQVPDGKSGNMKLDVKASYSPFKYCCFPNLRTFIYKGEGPRYLTQVVREPNVMEVDKHGNVIQPVQEVSHDH